MALATIPGYPRIGRRRELKWALEGFWSGKRDAADLARTAAAVRARSAASRLPDQKPSRAHLSSRLRPMRG